MILNFGVPINITDFDHRTALHISCSENHLEAVKFLAENGGDVNAHDRWGNTPLDEALKSENKEIFDYLIKKG